LILSFFGISRSALRIGGGLVVASSGWVMLADWQESESKEARPSINLESAKKMAFFPFTMLLTTAPGTIAAFIALAANRHDGPHGTLSSAAIWIFVAAAVSLTIFHAYGRANRMARFSALMEPALLPVCQPFCCSA
jgi:multiple antibiotic resistance protein